MAWPPNFKIYDRKTHFSAGSGGKGRSDKVETEAKGYGKPPGETRRSTSIEY